METLQLTRPIPVVDDATRPYWEAADRHELVIQKCEDCNVYLHPPGPTCSQCGESNFLWENLGVEIYGKIYSYIISYRPYLPGFEKKTPLINTIVELENIPDVKIYANLLDTEESEVQIGKRVKMVWEQLNEERSLPQWVLAE